MSLYVADLHALRTQKIISSKFNLELNEPYTWFDYFIDEAVANNHKYILYHEYQIPHNLKALDFLMKHTR